MVGKITAALLITACSGRNGNGHDDDLNTPPPPGGKGNGTPAEPTLVVAINAGSSQSVTWDGVEYGPDRFSAGGTPSSTAADIAGVDEQAQALFQTERYGTYTYEVPVTDAQYSVELHFVEMFHSTAGNRSFAVTVEEGVAFTALDLFVAVGRNHAYSAAVDNVSVNDGYLTISLETQIDNATISGFAVYSVDGALREVEEVPDEPVGLSFTPGHATSENTGADCDVVALSAFDELTSHAKLPDPFTALDGERLTQQDQWRCRRQEMHRLAERYVYGFKPEKPASVSGSLDNDALTVTVEHEGESITFNATVDLPEGAGPFPAIINVGAGGLTLGSELVKEEGIAIIYFNNDEIGAQPFGEPRHQSQGRGLFYELYGKEHSAGALMTWAWGASRLIDALEGLEDSIIDPAALAVTGCSRNGKGALAIGAFDQRIALTIPVEPGTGGVALMRSAADEGGQSPSSAYGEQPWLSWVFEPFIEAIDRLPLDQHMVAGLVAPRPLLVLDNPHIEWLAPIAGHTSALAVAEIYSALGASDHLVYDSDVSDETHCQLKVEHEPLVREQLRAHLLGTGSAVGAINAHASAQGTLDEWRDWETPDLND